MWYDDEDLISTVKKEPQYVSIYNSWFEECVTGITFPSGKIKKRMCDKIKNIPEREKLLNLKKCSNHYFLL